MRVSTIRKGIRWGSQDLTIREKVPLCLENSVQMPIKLSHRTYHTTFFAEKSTVTRGYWGSVIHSGSCLHYEFGIVLVVVLFVFGIHCTCTEFVFPILFRFLTISIVFGYRVV